MLAEFTAKYTIEGDFVPSSESDSDKNLPFVDSKWEVKEYARLRALKTAEKSEAKVWKTKMRESKHVSIINLVDDRKKVAPPAHAKVVDCTQDDNKPDGKDDDDTPLVPSLVDSKFTMILPPRGTVFSVLKRARKRSWNFSTQMMRFLPLFSRKKKRLRKRPRLSPPKSTIPSRTSIAVLIRSLLELLH